jgi:hypothetical protein
LPYVAQSMQRRLTKELIHRGSRLVYWLNEKAKTGPRSRVQTILNLVQKLNLLVHAQHAKATKARPAGPAQGWEEIIRIERELEQITRQYQTWPRFGAESDCRSIDVAHIWNGGPEEAEATQTIEALLKAGFIERIALCAQCKKRWVFVTRSIDKFCQRQCRQKWYEDKPSRKEKRKKYLEKYYRDKKEREKRQDEVWRRIR